jgi:TorA maturation chaperone TorD
MPINAISSILIHFTKLHNSSSLLSEYLFHWQSHYVAKFNRIDRYVCYTRLPVNYVLLTTLRSITT